MPDDLSLAERGRVMADRNRIIMAFRIGGPAWKTLGLLLGEQEVSRGKALEVLRDIALGVLSERQVEDWMRSLGEPISVIEVGDDGSNGIATVRRVDVYGGGAPVDVFGVKKEE